MPAACGSGRYGKFIYAHCTASCSVNCLQTILEIAPAMLLPGLHENVESGVDRSSRLFKFRSIVSPLAQPEAKLFSFKNSSGAIRADSTNTKQKLTIASEQQAGSTGYKAGLTKIAGKEPRQPWLSSLPSQLLIRSSLRRGASAF